MRVKYEILTADEVLNELKIFLQAEIDEQRAGPHENAEHVFVEVADILKIIEKHEA